MEKTLTGIIDSLKRYFQTTLLFFRGKIGFYFKLFRNKNQHPEGEKYFTLLFSFLFFFIAGKSLIVANEKLNQGFVTNFYNEAVSNALSNQSFKYLFGRILIYVAILEILAYLFGKNTTSRKQLSQLSFLFASWFLILMTFTLIGISLYNTVIPWFHLSPATLEDIEPFIGLPAMYLGFRMYSSPYRGFSLGQKRNLISKNLKYKGLILAFLVPAAFILISREIFPGDPEDKVYFLDKKSELLDLKIDSSKNGKVWLSTSFIFESKQESSYIFNPERPSFKASWRIVSGVDRDGKDIVDHFLSDSIFFYFKKDHAIVSLLKNNPVKLELQTEIDSLQISKLKYLRDSTVEKIFNIWMLPLNKETLFVMKPRFRLLNE